MFDAYTYVDISYPPDTCSRNDDSGNPHGHPCRQVPKFLGPVTVPSVGFGIESFKRIGGTSE